MTAHTIDEALSAIANNFLPIGSVEEEHMNPWIFTAVGYLRQSDLVLFHRWEETEGSTNYIEGYTYNGVVVKQGLAVRSKFGVVGQSLIGAVNGPAAIVNQVFEE